VIAGQGTVGEEIVWQLGGRPVDAVVVAVGGGGLVSGVAAAIKSALPGVKVIGASPAKPLCTELVDEWALVEEPEIHSALRFMIVTEHHLVEGSAAMAIAAGLQASRSRAGQTIAIVSCGANISSAALAEAVGAAAPAS
jgi:threonine dehydratase